MKAPTEFVQLAHSWLPPVPSHWEVKPFRRVFEESAEVNGSEPVGVMLSVSGYRGVEPKEYEHESQMRTADMLENYRVVRPGQLAVNTMWLNYAGLGVSEHLGYVSPAYRSFWIRTPCDRRYLHHLLRSEAYVRGYTGHLRGIRPNSLQMDRDTLMNWPILLPPLDEQVAIADYLDRETARIDTLIEEQQRLIDLLRERRQAVIESEVGSGPDAAVPTKTSGLSWVERVPEHWSVANIRRFASMKTGHTPSRSNPDYWVDCTIPWFTLADVWQLRDGKRTYLEETANQISEVGLANSAAELLPTGTVVLSRTASVGFTGVMPVPMATSQDFWNWIPGDALDGMYLMWVFRAMQREFRALMIGSTHQTIYQPTAAAIRIPVPPLDEQQRIVAYLNEQTAKIDTLIAETERFIELARERRSALITAAVTGQIDLRTAA